MPLVLSNEDVKQVFTIEECLDLMRQTFRDLGEGVAVTGPRIDHVVPGPVPESIYNLKTMSGIVPGSDVAALRVNSEIKVYPNNARQEKLPLATGDHFVGLVFLFSVSTGELLAIFPDGVLQQMRVAATSALGADYLARKDAATLALIGAGWQARGHAASFRAVRPITRIQVYSPNPAHAHAFADEVSTQLDAEVVPAASAAEAVRGSDIIAAVTNAQIPVLQPEWIEPGMHLSCVRMLELGKAVLARCDLIGMNWNWQRRVETDMYTFQAPGTPMGKVQDFLGQRTVVDDYGLDLRQCPELAEFISGKAPGRTSDRQITRFLNKGWGAQFSATGARILELARVQGLGHELPAQWFLQDVHP